MLLSRKEMQDVVKIGYLNEVHRVHPLLMPLWNHILFDEPCPNLTELPDHLFSQTRVIRIRIPNMKSVFPISYEDIFHGSVGLSPLSCALLFHKYELFNRIFHLCCRREISIIRKQKEFDPFDQRRVVYVALWTLLSRVPEWLMTPELFAKDHFVSVFSKIMMMFFVLRKSKNILPVHLDHLQKNVIKNEERFVACYALAFRLLRMDLRTYFPRSQKSLRRHPTRHAERLPPLTFSTLLQIPEPRDFLNLFDLNVVSVLKHHIVEILWHHYYAVRKNFEILLQYFPQATEASLKGTVAEIRRWQPVLAEEFLKRLKRLLLPQLQNPNSRPRSRVDKKIASSLAFEVIDSDCKVQQVNGRQHISFFIGKVPHLVIMSSEDYTRDFATNMLFLKHRTCLRKLPPDLRTRIAPRFHDRIPRLTFDRVYHSDGILVPAWPLARGAFTPTGVHGFDVTSTFEFYKATRGIPPVVGCFREADWLFSAPDIQKAFYANDLKGMDLYTFLLLFSLHPFFQLISSMSSLVQTTLWLLIADPQWRPKLISKQTKNKLRLFWTQLDSFSQGDPLARCLYLLGIRTQDNTLPTLLKLIPHPSDPPLRDLSLFNQMLDLIRMYSLPLTPIRNCQDPRMLTILFSRDINGELRRLAWHSIYRTWQNFRMRPTIHTFGQRPRVPIQLSLDAHDEENTTLVFDRATARLLNPHELLDYFGTPFSPWEIDFEIAGENEAAGVSVYTEVLHLAWKSAVQKHRMIPYEDDTFCVNTTNQSDDSDLFILGCLSAICVARGLFLPYPLYSAFWKFLTTVDDGISLVPLSDTFSTRIVYYTELWSDYTNQQLQEIMNFSDSDMLMSRVELAALHMIPNFSDISKFRSGWQMFMGNVPLHSIYSHLNDMFVEPSRRKIEYQAFVSCFRRNADYSMQEEWFLQWLQALTPQELERVVKFITGKDRLPYCELGEEQISICWSQENTFVKSQNCTHTLVMPECDQSTCISVFMKPVLEYDTVFGFM